MKKFNTIYKRATTGAVQEWTIIVDGNTFYTLAGQVGGAITRSKPTTCEGKNIGRANETSPEAQAEFEAAAKQKKKLETGYFLSLEEIDNDIGYFEPMLAKEFNEEKHKINWKVGVIVQPKLDGIRAIISKDSAKTRKGKEHKSIPHILRKLDPLSENDPNLILDGEIYNHELHDDFNKISSVVRKQKPTAEDLKESERLAQFHCYDCPCVGDLTQASSFIKRHEAMQKLLEGIAYVVVVPNLMAYSEEEVKKCHDIFVAQGYEGCIIRVPDSPYLNKRCDFLLKYKEFIDEEFTIEAISHGTGNKAEMAATVTITTKAGVKCEPNIKAPHAFLRTVWLNKDYYIGKVCTVRYFGVTPDGSLRFPRVIDLDRWSHE